LTPQRVREWILINFLPFFSSTVWCSPTVSVCRKKKCEACRFLTFSF
jgi:hypothetical protein